MAGRKIAAVLFDMDETLVEHTLTGMELMQGTYRAFADRLDGVDEAAFARTVWRKANDLWQMMFDGVLSGEIARPYTFINALRQLKADDSMGHEMLKYFELRLVESTRLTDDAFDVLDTLRRNGIRTGIVTNGYTIMQMRKLTHHGLPQRVDFVLVSEAVGFHKPHRGIFEVALSKANTAPDQTLFVGDNLTADIAGALGAGMEAVLYDPEGARRRQLDADPELRRPTHVIARHCEVLDIAGVQPVVLAND